MEAGLKSPLVFAPREYLHQKPCQEVGNALAAATDGKFWAETPGFWCASRWSQCLSDRWGSDGGGLAVLRPELDCGSSWCPGAREPCQPLPPQRSPCAAEGPGNTPRSCRLLFSRPDNLISFHLPPSCRPDPARSPSPSSEPFASPWDAGPGAGVVPASQPLCRTVPCAGGGHGHCAPGCVLCSLPAPLQTHIPDSAALFVVVVLLLIPFCWELAFVIDCI